MNVNGRIWFETPQGTFAGEGRIALLEKVKQYGSINKAAKSMKMSYRQAWEEIDTMNSQYKKPLVIKVSGGIGGGGSEVTPEGEKVIKLYKKIKANFIEFVKQQSKSL